MKKIILLTAILVAFFAMASVVSAKECTDKDPCTFAQEQLVHFRIGGQFVMDFRPTEEPKGVSSSGHVVLSLAVIKHWDSKKTGVTFTFGGGAGVSVTGGLGYEADLAIMVHLGVPWAKLGITGGIIGDAADITDGNIYIVVGAGPVLEFQVRAGWFVSAKVWFGSRHELDPQLDMFAVAVIIGTGWQF